MADAGRAAATALLPLKLRLALRSVQRKLKLQSVPVGTVQFGSLRRLDPISPIFGKDRDLVSIERFYIESFLESASADVKGRVLELGDASYTKRFGGQKVTKSEVLHYVPGNPDATIVGDFTKPETIPTDAFD
ncbi:MAG: methyltransferase, partial [Cytophagaceae bacterium]